MAESPTKAERLAVEALTEIGLDESPTANHNEEHLDPWARRFDAPLALNFYDGKNSSTKRALSKTQDTSGPRDVIIKSRTKSAGKPIDSRSKLSGMNYSKIMNKKEENQKERPYSAREENTYGIMDANEISLNSEIRAVQQESEKSKKKQTLLIKPYRNECQQVIEEVPSPSLSPKAKSPKKGNKSEAPEDQLKPNSMRLENPSFTLTNIKNSQIRSNSSSRATIEPEKNSNFLTFDSYLKKLQSKPEVNEPKKLILPNLNTSQNRKLHTLLAMDQHHIKDFSFNTHDMSMGQTFSENAATSKPLSANNTPKFLVFTRKNQTILKAPAVLKYQAQNQTKMLKTLSKQRNNSSFSETSQLKDDVDLMIMNAHVNKNLLSLVKSPLGESSSEGQKSPYCRSVEPKSRESPRDARITAATSLNNHPRMSSLGYGNQKRTSKFKDAQLLSNLSAGNSYFDM